MCGAIAKWETRRNPIDGFPLAMYQTPGIVFCFPAGFPLKSVMSPKKGTARAHRAAFGLDWWLGASGSCDGDLPVELLTIMLVKAQRVFVSFGHSAVRGQ